MSADELERPTSAEMIKVFTPDLLIGLLEVKEEEKVRIMIEKGGFDFNYASKDSGTSILHAAVFSGMIDCVEDLLEGGANPNVRNFDN